MAQSEYQAVQRKMILFYKEQGVNIPSYDSEREIIRKSNLCYRIDDLIGWMSSSVVAVWISMARGETEKNNKAFKRVTGLGELQAENVSACETILDIMGYEFITESVEKMVDLMRAIACISQREEIDQQATDIAQKAMYSATLLLGTNARTVEDIKKLDDLITRSIRTSTEIYKANTSDAKNILLKIADVVDQEIRRDIPAPIRLSVVVRAFYSLLMLGVVTTEEGERIHDELVQFFPGWGRPLHVDAVLDEEKSTPETAIFKMLLEKPDEPSQN